MVLKKEKKVSRVSIYFIALLIPSFLCLDSMQSLKYVSIQREIRELEKTRQNL